MGIEHVGRFQALEMGMNIVGQRCDLFTRGRFSFAIEERLEATIDKDIFIVIATLAIFGCEIAPTNRVDDIKNSFDSNL